MLWFTSASTRSGGRVLSTRLRVSRGRARTLGGQSHSCDTPTSQSASPSAPTISVADGNSETTLFIASSQPRTGNGETFTTETQRDLNTFSPLCVLGVLCVSVV